MGKDTGNHLNRAMRQLLTAVAVVVIVIVFLLCRIVF